MTAVTVNSDQRRSGNALVIDRRGEARESIKHGPNDPAEKYQEKAGPDYRQKRRGEFRNRQAERVVKAGQKPLIVDWVGIFWPPEVDHQTKRQCADRGPRGMADVGRDRVQIFPLKSHSLCHGSRGLPNCGARSRINRMSCRGAAPDRVRPPVKPEACFQHDGGRDFLPPPGRSRSFVQSTWRWEVPDPGPGLRITLATLLAPAHLRLYGPREFGAGTPATHEKGET